MKLKVTKKFESSIMEIEIENSDEKKALSQAFIFTQPDECSLCKSKNIVWDSNRAKTDDGEFIYIKRTCIDCGARSNLGSYKTGGYFWSKFEIWKPEQTNQQDSTVKVKPQEIDPFENIPTDLPF